MIGYVHIDKQQKLIDAYRAEHREEKDEITGKIADLKKQISAVNAEAAAVVCPEIGEHEAAAAKLAAEKDKVMLEEINSQKAVMDSPETERSSLGIFKFSARKEINAEIDAENDKLSDIPAQADSEKAEFGKKIKAENDQVEQLKKDVENRKNGILEKAKPMQSEITQLEAKLSNPLV